MQSFISHIPFMFENENNPKRTDMKKNFMKQILAGILLCAPMLLPAQLKETLDPAIRMGKLDNGLTYYICHNELPADRVEFYIAQRVGSILEEEPQRGLAHFLEHMAFNGTKNYPGKTMIDYLEKNGVKFGINLNAYTSIDETVYNISEVPAREGLIDSCLLILHDWASAIALEEEEIDAERKVIHEEWRTRNSADLRMLESIISTLYPDSNRYGNRLPIGLMEVVDNFPYQAIRDYYHKWYRPDLQGIIVVGDVDVDKVEAKIKELWRDVPAPVNAAVRNYVQIPDNDEPLVAIVSDKEAQANMLQIYYKLPVEPEGASMTMEAVRTDVVRALIAMMLNARYNELTQVAEPPFLSASASVDDYYIAFTRKAYILTTFYKTGMWRPALDAMIAATKQALQYGFTQAELDRAVAELSSSVERSYNERATRKNPAFVNMALEHFLYKEPQLSEEYFFELYNEMIPTISLQELDAHFRNFFPADGKNISFVMKGEESENSNMPSSEELLNAYAAAWQTAVSPYEEEYTQRPLIAQMPAKGSVVKTKENKKLDATEYTLSNGAKVVIKTTDFKADEISMYAVSEGGNSLFDLSELPNFSVMNTLASIGGLGDFSPKDLMKQLSGVQASASASISTYNETVTGSSNVKDFEKLLQLTYLRFTTVRADSALFVAWKSRMSNSLKLAESDPMRPISDTLSYLSYGDHPRARRFTQADLDRVDYLHTLDLFSQRLNNAADFTFIFIGNIDKEKALPLIEQYIGALPSTGKHEKANEKALPKPRTGYRESVFEQPMESPKTMVYISYAGKEKYNLKNRMIMSILSQVMEVVYTETIREEEGGTYGVSTGGDLSLRPKGRWTYTIQFDTNTEMAARLSDRTVAELTKIGEEGPAKEIFDKVKTFMVKSYQNSIKENSYWLSQLVGYYTTGSYTVDDYLPTLEKITTEDVQKLAKKIVSSPDEIKMICYGVEKQ